MHREANKRGASRQVTKSGKSVGRAKNSAYRTREHLRPEEVAALIKAAEASGRHGQRDAAAIRLAFRHGLRAAEVCNLRRDQFDLERGELHVKRLKNGKSSTQPIEGRDLRTVRKLLRETDGSYLFVTERGTPLDRSGFLKIVRRAGQLAGIPFPVHPHMLRHATGYYMANSGQDTRKIQDYLGHQSIQHTVRYTELAPGKFKGLWDNAPF